VVNLGGEIPKKENAMNDDTHEETFAPSLWDRIGIGALALLLIAFLVGTMAPLMSSAGAEIAGNRDDGSGELVAVEDDDDDDDLAKGSNSGNSSHSGNGNSNSKSNSANTPTGTTKGTGDSKSVTNSSSRSANTKTGTTNTGASRKSVSNSS
jgi:hypothetical protein